MSEVIIAFLQAHGIPTQAIIFLISMTPIFELRVGLIAASILNVPILQAFLICFVANIIPIPFILLFIKVIFEFFKKHNILTGFIGWLEERAMKRSDSVKTKQFVGLLLFVAIPLPGTGAWTGALIASLLDMDIKKSFLAIALGVFFAGIIMIILTYFIPGLFGF